MTTLSERDLTFAFTGEWTAVKWDESEYRSRRGHHGRALDILGVLADGPERSLWMIEIKDFPDHPQARSITPLELATACSEKVRDSLAQLVWGPAEIGQPGEPEVKELSRRFGSTAHPLGFVLWIEDARLHPLDVTELQAELEASLRWLPLRMATTMSLGAGVSLPGLKVTRA